MTRYVLTITWLVAGVPMAVFGRSAQRLPFSVGGDVRVTPTECAARGLWTEGTVLGATRSDLWMAVPNGDSLRVRFQPQTRVQVGRRSAGPVVGGALGFVVGGLVGGLVGTVASSGPFLTHAGPLRGVIIGAPVGTIMGYMIGKRATSDRWREVRLVDGRVPGVPLVDPNPPRRSFNDLERWTRFDASEADFATFFEDHKDSLEFIEGIWSDRMGMRRIAIVREGGFEDYEYVAVRLYTQPGPRDIIRTGEILFALKPTGRDYEYDLRFTRGPARLFRADHLGDLLTIHGTAAQQHWGMVTPAHFQYSNARLPVIELGC